MREIMQPDGVGEREQILLEREQGFDVERGGLDGGQRRLRRDRKPLRPLDQAVLLQARQCGDVLVKRGDLERNRARIIGIEHREIAHRRQCRPTR